MQKQPLSYDVVSQPILLPSAFPVDLLENYIQSDANITYLHYHNCLELGYCWEGSGVFFVEEKILPYSKGDVSIIFPGQLHLAQSVKGQVSGWHFIFIDLKVLLGTVAPSSWEGAAPVGYSRLANIVRPEESPGIAILTEYLIQELSRKQSGYETAAKGCALSLASLITRAISQAADRAPEIETVDRTSINKISKSLHYISQHYMETIHTQELAAICNLSVTHFRRTFRTCMGAAPLDYLINMRMQMASALLCHTDGSILSISEKVGYSTLSSFNRHFKIWMGAAPSKWRAMNR